MVFMRKLGSSLFAKSASETVLVMSVPNDQVWFHVPPPSSDGIDSNVSASAILAQFNLPAIAVRSPLFVSPVSHLFPLSPSKVEVSSLKLCAWSYSLYNAWD
ncbi:hypothetical protein P8452_04857 [Trifolium repens]|nr:hypothetical protein P8452_04857 [Trifolium repens]